LKPVCVLNKPDFLKLYASPIISNSIDFGSTLFEMITRLSNILCNPTGSFTTNSNSKGSCLLYHFVGFI
jgi:hypothetical protein